MPVVGAELLFHRPGGYCCQGLLTGASGLRVTRFLLNFQTLVSIIILKAGRWGCTVLMENTWPCPSGCWELGAEHWLLEKLRGQTRQEVQMRLTVISLYPMPLINFHLLNGDYLSSWQIQGLHYLSALGPTGSPKFARDSWDLWFWEKLAH